ncbi:uncharacterized protein LOC143299096 [Babylonia areolata]|uniref:uncharacterized protein LOC143299096 n=1 Tax=Babylonia areolata TaxID=304850 RepID=UPI003FD1F749
MRCICGGLAELQTFCGILNLPPPVQKSSHNKTNKTIYQAASAEQTESMARAAAIEHELADGEGEVKDVDVSVDGTYMTRGHTSNIGVTSAIGCQTGKVLDIGSLSKTCKGCDYGKSLKSRDPGSYRHWLEEHEAVCTLTHGGSSGSMEAEIAKGIFSRSLQQYNLRYTRFIGDGDTNSFKSVMNSYPYGQETVIEKIECVGHVQKRMGTRLRNLKKGMKGRALADGKSIGGKGRLTDAEINKIQNYYGNAIRGNKHNLYEMKKAVWAIFYHKLSSDELDDMGRKRHFHAMCSITWCTFKQAEADNTVDTYRHKNNLPQAVMEVVKPVFADLAKKELLEKCLEGYTQNANESFNNLIWKYSPKTKNNGLTVVNTAAAIAVCVFNDGANTLGNILVKLGMSVGAFTERFLQDKDTLRILTSQRRAHTTTKEYRRRKRLQRLGREEELAEIEGFPYLAGGH